MQKANLKLEESFIPLYSLHFSGISRHCVYDIMVVELHIIGYNRICSNFSHHVCDIICVKSKCKPYKLDTINIPFQEG